MNNFHNPNSPIEDDEFQSTTLHTAPSFEIYNNSHGEFGVDEQDPEVLKRISLADGNGEFSFRRMGMTDLIEEAENEKDGLSGIPNLSVEEEDVEPASPPLYLATGLGVANRAGFGGEVGSDNRTSNKLFTSNLAESEDLEEYYKKMVDEYPLHPVFLKEFAKILQSKGDFDGAEDCFLRATLADPDDGETLMQYARLVWEHHHDKDRALSYFERAAEAAPHDSHVLAAYASFLWETEDNENEVGQHETQNDNENQETELVKPSKEESDLVATGQEVDATNLPTSDCSNYSDGIDDLKKMIDESPNNPLLLKKYAQFLFKSKRDLEAAEDYYARAILADPSDGEIMSEYAKLEWELHHDQEKALFLFEQAVQATPGNSNVLAAYTCFLWEVEDGES